MREIHRDMSRARLYRPAALWREHSLKLQAQRIGRQCSRQVGAVLVFLWIEFRHHCLLLVGRQKTTRLRKV